MATDIHPTAIICEGAQLDDGVVVGPYAYIGPKVKIGKGSKIHHHATVDGRTAMGRDNEVYPYAFIGGMTQDLKYTGGDPGVKIGDRNTFREYVSVHVATKAEEDTIMGDDNHILAYSHVAHDCIVGNHLVMSSHAALGGHCIVEDHVVIGWDVGIHQFCRLGSYVMVGACSKVVQDVFPFMIVFGNPAEVRAINKVGLERHDFGPDEIALAKTVHRILYRDGMNRTQALSTLKDHPEHKSRVIKSVLRFAETATRGLA